MNLQYIETADCNIFETEISPNKIKIYFESVYDLEKNSTSKIFVCQFLIGLFLKQNLLLSMS